MTRQGSRAPVGPLVMHVPAFRAFALDRGYTPATTALLAKEVRSLSAWMHAAGYDTDALSESLVGEYRRWLPGSGRRRVPTAGEFRALLAYARHAGIAPASTAPPASGLDLIVDRYRCWLRDQRGLADSTEPPRVQWRLVVSSPAVAGLVLERWYVASYSSGVT